MDQVLYICSPFESRGFTYNNHVALWVRIFITEMSLASCRLGLINWLFWHTIRVLNTQPRWWLTCTEKQRPVSSLGGVVRFLKRSSAILNKEHHLVTKNSQWNLHRADSRLAPSQWEKALQSNTLSHWLGANLESALWQKNTCLTHSDVWILYVLIYEYTYI